MSSPCIDALLFVNAFDDASMWLSKPGQGSMQPLAGSAPDASRAVLKKRALKGIMRHVPVLNSCETLFKLWPAAPGSSSSPPFVAATGVCSPARALPEANWSTVLDRWRRWSAC
eukprot:1985636-Pyramimonas_sp.AAC.1